MRYDPSATPDHQHEEPWSQECRVPEGLALDAAGDRV
jgi:hypothetical protein